MMSGLFWTFFKIGAFTIGGGYAMVPVIQHEVVSVHQWLSDEEFVDILAIAEATPGPIAVNTASYVGYRHSKLRGSIIATLGVVLPSFLIILLVASFLWGYRDHPMIEKAFLGIRPAVVALIVAGLYKMTKKLGATPKNLGIMSLVAAGMYFFKWRSVWILLASAIFGILWARFVPKGEK